MVGPDFATLLEAIRQATTPICCSMLLLGYVPSSESGPMLRERSGRRDPGAARRAGRLLLKLNGATVDPPGPGSSR